jgi:uncharacterized protein (TIGR03089 family)
VSPVQHVGRSSSSPTTFPAALAALLRAAPSRPLVTFYDDATGERVELSVTTFANWVAKTAGLARDELDLEPGALVLLDLPTHWLGAVWLGAAWTLGLTVTDEPDLAGEADLVVTGPDGLGRYSPEADRVPVQALSLRPLGGRFTEPLPSGVTDYSAVVLAQPDVFVAYDPPRAEDPAWRDAGGSVSQGELMVEAAGSPSAGPVVSRGGRLLTDVNPATRRGAVTLVAPVLLDAGTVWVRHPDERGWSARAEQERITDELRG